MIEWAKRQKVLVCRFAAKSAVIIGMMVAPMPQDGRLAAETMPITANGAAASPAAKKPRPVPKRTRVETKPSQHVPPATAFAGAPDFTGSLKQAGAATCAMQIDEAAHTVMDGVAMSNTISSWAPADGGRRLAFVAIGQKYANNDVPYGVTDIVATPNPAGHCDTVSVQVIPSPQTCDTILAGLQPGKAIANLAGIVVLKDEGIGHTLLLPTAGKTCVLIKAKPSFSK